MDAVITYVNGADPVWQEQYSAFVGAPVLAKRYRDWGLLPYLLRGIEAYMPFIDRVFLVVSGKSQVPTWASDKLRVVLHEDIIPRRFLPTFNSTTIELFLHRIPGLSEEYVYFNDDLYPINAIDKSDLFADGKVVRNFAHHLFAFGLYMQQSKWSDRYVRHHLGMNARFGLFVRPQHTIAPMLRSTQQELFDTIGAQLEPHITPLRRADNPNQYIYSDYLYYTHRTVQKRFSTKHCSMAVYTPDRIAGAIEGDTKIVCINDVTMSPEKEQRMKATLTAAFERKFPQKSQYEF